MAKILVVDDHPAVRKGICGVVESHRGWKVCGEASNGLEAVNKTSELHPDLVLMDISMPVMNGIQATKEIHRISPDVKIVVLSMHDSQEAFQQLMALGATSCVVKSASPEHLQEAIAAALKGGTALR